MHSSVLVIGVSNQEELEEALEPFYQLGCTMSQEEQRGDPRAEFDVQYTIEEAEKKYQEDIIEKPTREQLSFFRDNFLEPSDEETCRNMYQEKKKSTRYAPNGYTGEDFAYGNYKTADGESAFFFISEENMKKCKEWIAENKISMWNLQSGQSKEEFLEKTPDAHTLLVKDYDYEWNEEAQGYGYWNNPNGFWDWYQVGGRWIGFFSIKEESRQEAQLGEASLLMRFDEEDVKELRTRADILKVKDIDFDAMEENSIKNSAAQWDQMWEMINEHREGKTDEEVENRFREIMRIPEGEDRDGYIRRTKGIGVAAIVVAGEWFEDDGNGNYVGKSKGLKGDKISEDLTTFLKNMDPETSLMLVDCHR